MLSGDSCRPHGLLAQALQPQPAQPIPASHPPSSHAPRLPSPERVWSLEPLAFIYAVPSAWTGLLPLPT